MHSKNLGGKAYIMSVDYETTLQKQPFADVFQNRCSYEFQNIHRKTPVLESFFNNGTGKFIKKRLQNRCFPMNIAKFLGATFFTEHLRLHLFYLGTKVLENIVKRNGKKHTRDKFSNYYLGSPTQTDHIL